jgi:hypothetical protein
MKPVRIVSMLLCAVAAATAQSPEYVVVTQERIAGSFFGWTDVSQSAADWNPLSRTSFGIQGPVSIPTGSRVALFARGVVSFASQTAIDSYWPEANINLTPLAATTLTPPANCELTVGSGGLKVAPAEAQALLNLCAESQPSSLNPYTVALTGTPNATTVGAGWPAMQSGWNVSAFNSQTWTPAYDSRYAVPSVPGGTLHTFNLTRLAQKLVLRQSTNQTAALEFLRSSLLGSVIENTFTIQLQACIILPQANPPQNRRFIVTDVFEVYIHLIPGDGGASENAPEFGCTPEYEAKSTLTSQAGLIFDAGMGAPVVLALGVGSVPTAIRFSQTGGCGAGNEVDGIALNPLYPNDPFCSYWLVFRPPGVGGPVTSISVLPPTPLPSGEETDGTEVKVAVLPPRFDAIPMFDCPPDWWNLAASLPIYL